MYYLTKKDRSKILSVSLISLEQNMNVRKDVLCFLSRASIHHSFIFCLLISYELKRKVCLSKNMENKDFPFVILFYFD